MKLYLLMILFLAACSKPVPPVPVQTAPAQEPTPQAAPAPVPSAADQLNAIDDNRIALEKMGAVRMGTKPHKAHSNKQEKAAYAKAYKNAKLANTLLGEHKYREFKGDKV